MADIESSLPRLAIDPERAVGDLDCPEKARGRYAALEIVELHREVTVVGNTRTGYEEIHSKLGEGAEATLPVLGDINALHDAQIDLEILRTVRRLGGTDQVGQSHVADEVCDGAGLHVKPH